MPISTIFSPVRLILEIKANPTKNTPKPSIVETWFGPNPPDNSEFEVVPN